MQTTALCGFREDTQLEAVRIASSNTTQQGLLIATTACTALTLIPSCRVIGALGARSIALLTAVSSSSGSWAQQSLLDKILTCLKVAGLVVGIIGVAMSSPVLILASLIADTAIQTFEMFKALYKGDYVKAAICFSAVAINSLMIAALVLGSWKLVAIAGATCMLAMGALALYVWKATPRNENESRDQKIRGVCLTILSILGGVTVLTSTGVIDSKRVAVGNPRLIQGQPKLRIHRKRILWDPIPVK